MELVLITLGVVGLAAMVLSAYVFTVAARNYVSDEQQPSRRNLNNARNRTYITRSPVDRRKGGAVTFPLVINNVLIPKDRRILPERRLSQAREAAV